MNFNVRVFNLFLNTVRMQTKVTFKVDKNRSFSVTEKMQKPLSFQSNYLQ